MWSEKNKKKKTAEASIIGLLFCLFKLIGGGKSMFGKRNFHFCLEGNYESIFILLDCSIRRLILLMKFIKDGYT